MGKYSIDEIKRFAAKGEKMNGLDAHESVIYHTLSYCYRTYRKNPTESARKRLKEFSDPVIAFHYGRKD